MTRLTKLTSLRGLCLFVGLLFCISTFATNRPRVPKTNWENSMGHSGNGMCIEILNDNRLIIHFSIGTALPNIDDFPELYVEYDFGGYLEGTWGPITNNDLIPAIFNGYNAFEADTTFFIDLDPLCTRNDPPTHTNPSIFAYSFKIVTPLVNGNGTELYPVLEYPDLFPENVFPEVGEPDFTPEYGGDKFLCCMPLGTSRTEPSDNETQVASNEVINAPVVSIFPNPTNEDLNIEVNSKEEAIQIDLIGIDGKVIRAIRREKNINGYYTERIDMSGLPKGMYFCRINSGSISEMHKVIKL